MKKTVTKKELAEIFQMTEAGIDKLRSHGLPDFREGRYIKFNLSDAVIWYVNYKEQAMAKRFKSSSTSEDSQDYEQMKIKWAAIRERNRTLREAKWLITVEEANTDLVYRLGQLREALVQIPVTWGPYILGLETLPEGHKKLTQLTDDLMTALTEIWEEPVPEEEFDHINKDEVDDEEE